MIWTGAAEFWDLVSTFFQIYYFGIVVAGFPGSMPGVVAENVVFIVVIMASTPRKYVCFVLTD